MYTERVMKHFKHPKNQGKLKNANGIGEVGNPTCGDVMKMYVYVENGMIKDISWETYGCVAAIATSSVLTTLVKGKTIEEALKITKDDVAKELGGLPSMKMHCSILAVDALKKAIEDYRSKEATI
ncbi:iron-sulfur cluster assembly scaffold protein [Candidatus Woesearchaeota archaeon]|nr:MAG: iron-sulfur cluster assembly scaffold protein [Candidatus Woesearchaeota archaeon]